MRAVLPVVSVISTSITMSRGVGSCVLLLVCCAVSWSVADDVVVDTEYGPVLGHTVPIDDGSLINSFLAIPFAAPPLDELRWKAPEPPEPWELFEADQLGSACIQNIVLGTIVITHPGWTDFSEDCLNLNIYAPADPTNGPYPVMVWLHGGGYQSSANIQYPGHFLATRDVVVVVPNYRLGIFGFASSNDEELRGNYGMLDQLEALKFVQRNIANFGGDPNKVTIFGESAGAGSVGLMMMSPLARDYFHQAILQSGSEMTVWAYNGPEVEPETWIHEVAAQHDCDDGHISEVMDCLRQVGPWLLHNSDFNCSFCLGFAPVIDGDGGFLPDNPLNLRNEGNFAKVPMLEGITREDGFLFAVIFGAGNLTDFDGVSREDFEEHLRAAVELFGYLIEDEETKDAVFEALFFFYAPWPHVRNESANLHELGMMITDVMFGFPTDLQIKMHSPHADSYYYVFGYRGSNHGDILPEWMGVPHALELPYVFGFPMLKTNPAVRNDTQMFIDPIDWTEEDRVYADLTMDFWANFAKFRTPTPEPVGTPDGGSVTWDTWTEQEHKYMYIANDVVQVREDYRQKDYAFWTHYLNRMVFGDELPPLPLRTAAAHRRWKEAYTAYTDMLVTNVLDNAARHRNQEA